jgi:hypothetical protein
VTYGIDAAMESMETPGEHTRPDRIVAYPDTS